MYTEAFGRPTLSFLQPFNLQHLSMAPLDLSNVGDAIQGAGESAVNGAKGIVATVTDKGAGAVATATDKAGGAVASATVSSGTNGIT